MGSTEQGDKGIRGHAGDKRLEGYGDTQGVRGQGEGQGDKGTRTKRESMEKQQACLRECNRKLS